MNANLANLKAVVQADPSRPVGWLSGLKEIGDYASQSPRSVQRLIAAGHLKVRRLSAKSICCKPSDVDAAIRSAAKAYEEASI